MKKASVLIIVSVLLATLFCVAGCASGVTYTDEESGISISLPREWQSYTEEDLEEMSEENMRLAFFYDEEPYSETITCYAVSGFDGQTISDYSKENLNDYYSSWLSVDEVTLEELPSGTYYRVKGTSTEDDAYLVVYATMKNGYLIEYQYSANDGIADHDQLSDFEDMVENAEYITAESESSDTTGSDESGDGSSDESSSESSEEVKYTEEKYSGYSITLPSKWSIPAEGSLGNMIENEVTTVFCCYGLKDEYIQCAAVPDYKGQKITDYSKKDVSKFYSATLSDEKVKKKKLKSGTYYQTKGTGLYNKHYYVIYDTIKNGCQVRYIYDSFGGESYTPHLSDFEEMVDNASY